MLGTALQFGGVRGGDDRFYIPVKARKNQNQRKQAQKAESGGDSTPKSKLVAAENESPETLCASVESVSNIDRFLESTTPFVPAQYFSKVDLNSIHDFCFLMGCF